MKILAIDDNKDNLVSLQALIKDAFPDAVTLTAQNGKRGLELAAAEDPDVILLDVVMPEMDGFEVCKKLKADKILKDIPVVFVTALKGDKENRIRALECGADAFLAKPIEVSELTAQVRAMAKIKTASNEKLNEKEQLTVLVEEQTRKLKDTHAATLNLLEDVRKENEARKKSEEKLRESEYIYRTILLTAIDGFWLVNTQGQLLEVNESYCRMSGYTEQELLTMRISDLESVETCDTAAAHIQMIITKGEDRFESKHHKKDGTVFPVEVNVKFWDIQGGRFICFVQDVTERKRAETEIQQQLAELRRWQAVMLEREDRSMKLKGEVNELARRVGEPVRYPSQEQ